MNSSSSSKKKKTARINLRGQEAINFSQGVRESEKSETRETQPPAELYHLIISRRVSFMNSNGAAIECMSKKKKKLLARIYTYNPVEAAE